MQPSDQLGLGVGLADLDVQPELGTFRLAQVDQLVVPRGAVDLGLARPAILQAPDPALLTAAYAEIAR